MLQCLLYNKIAFYEYYVKRPTYACRRVNFREHVIKRAPSRSVGGEWSNRALFVNYQAGADWIESSGSHGSYSWYRVSRHTTVQILIWENLSGATFFIKHLQRT